MRGIYDKEEFKKTLKALGYKIPIPFNEFVCEYSHTTDDGSIVRRIYPAKGGDMQNSSGIYFEFATTKSRYEESAGLQDLADVVEIYNN